MVVFWVTTLCKIVNLLQCVGQTCCHHIQGYWIRFWLPRRRMQQIFLNLENRCIILHCVVIYKNIIWATSAMEAWNACTLMCSGTIGLWCITFWSYCFVIYRSFHFWGEWQTWKLHTILMFQDEHAPLPHVFTQVGWPAIMWIVTVGAVFALCTR